MFKPISKPKLWIIAQNAISAMAVVLGFSFSATAEDIKTYETLQVSCSSFTSNNLDQCDSSYSLSAESENQTVAQSRRIRGGRSKGNVDGYYGGFSIGVGLANGGLGFNNVDPDIEYANSFVGCIFGGIKFSRNFSADIEFTLVQGGLDSDEFDDFVNEDPNDIFNIVNQESDGDYSALAVYINPKFELPLTASDSFNLYISPGIGIAQTNVNFNSGDDIGDLFDSDFSNTGLAYQVKGGASYSFNRRTGVFGQLRYASIAADEDVDDINTFSIETGLKLTF
ncbi:MAG: outer membrane beta-barrel protein [Pleurocapsa sp.]